MTDLLQTRFEQLSNLLREHAATQPAHPAIRLDDQVLDYAALNTQVDRVAAALQRDGLVPGEAIAICAGTSIAYGVLFLGALRAGVAVAPLAPSSSPESLARMAGDAQARRLFLDASTRDTLALVPPSLPRVALDDTADTVPGSQAWSDWLAPAGTRAQAVALTPEHPFNIIYSSGTTGEPKGIVQSHGMRWGHIQRGTVYGYSPDGTTLLSTPLYSNTTLVSFFPTLGLGGTVVLQAKFDAGAWLRLAQQHHVTHAMLVPVQYQRLLAHPDFDRTDLSSFRLKFCTSAPFAADLKAEVLRRWPGALIEMYGMTEGGGTCVLEASKHPDKLHTVGKPAPGHDIRLIDDAGNEVAPGEAGEVAGHSPIMMNGYYGRPEKTREAEWFDPSGKRFIRTGDIGRFDADGFLTLFDRKKDMIISGGFNLYPSDLEAVLRQHPAVADVAVVGVPSVQWGETPVAAVVRRDGNPTTDAELLVWANEKLGRMQRLAALRCVEELPRSAIGKVLKRELRDSLGALNVA